MHLIGRWAKIRPLGPAGWGQPYMLDRKWRTLSPYQHPEWWYWKRHRTWVPTVRGGMGLSGVVQVPTPYLGYFGNATVSVTGLGLDSAYTFGGSPADAVGGRITLREALTLSSVYFFLTGYTGTASVVNDIEVAIHADDGTNVKPSSTVLATQTKNPASATGWMAATGFSLAMAADTSYWVSVSDADGNATNYATVLARATNLDEVVSLQWPMRIAADTTTGWTTLSIRTNYIAQVLAFSNGSALGMPFTGSVGPSSSTNRKGLLLNSLTEALEIYGLFCVRADANLSGAEIWEGTTGPGGSPWKSSTLDMYSNTGVRTGYLFAPTVTLEKATPYRPVFTVGAASVSPRKINIGTGADATLRSLMIGGGSWYYAEANGTTNWANDDINSWPQIALLVEDQVEVASAAAAVPGSRHAAYARRRTARSTYA